MATSPGSAPGRTPPARPAAAYLSVGPYHSVRSAGAGRPGRRTAARSPGGPRGGAWAAARPRPPDGRSAATAGLLIPSPVVKPQRLDPQTRPWRMVAAGKG